MLQGGAGIAGLGSASLSLVADSCGLLSATKHWHSQQCPSIGFFAVGSKVAISPLELACSVGVRALIYSPGELL